MIITTDSDFYTEQLATNELMRFSDRLIDSKASPPKEPPPARWPRLMKKRVAAEYLGISERALDGWVALGTIPGPTISPTERTKRWDKRALDERIDAIAQYGDVRAPSVGDLLSAHTHKKAGGPS